MKLSDIYLYDVGNTIQLVGAIYQGNGRTFHCWFPGESEADTVSDGLVMDLADWERFIRQTDLMEVEITAKQADETVGKAILRKSQRTIEQSVSWAVFRRDGYRCRYCGKDDVPLTVDHLVLYEVGGPSTVENMVSACKKCNRTRGNLEYGEWLQHPRYKQTSADLSPAVREQNARLVQTLANIPRRPHQRSR